MARKVVNAMWTMDIKRLHSEFQTSLYTLLVLCITPCTPILLHLRYTVYIARMESRNNVTMRNNNNNVTVLSSVTSTFYRYSTMSGLTIKTGNVRGVSLDKLKWIMTAGSHLWRIPIRKVLFHNEYWQGHITHTQELITHTYTVRYTVSWRIHTHITVS